MATRVLKTASATLERVFYVGEQPTDSSTTVTVTVVDATGATVASGNATSAGSGKYTFPLPAQGQLALLTVTWNATIATIAVAMSDLVEVCGGFFFTLAEGRGSDATLADTSKYPTADLIVARQEVEEECEWICDRAFVPRYRRVVLDGSGSSDLTLPDADITTIRSASVAPRAGQTFVALTPTELAALVVRADSTVKRVDSNIWTEGLANVIFEYEYGLVGAPADLVRAAKTRFRSRLNLNKSGVPDRATSFSTPDGTFRLSMPDAFRTGIPDVDAAYARHSRRVQAAAQTAQGGSRYPASRSLNYDPQRNALFHGGIR